MTEQRNITSKSKVLAVWPKAYCWQQYAEHWIVWYGGNKFGSNDKRGVLGSGGNPVDAWRDAACRLQHK